MANKMPTWEESFAVENPDSKEEMPSWEESMAVDKEAKDKKRFTDKEVLKNVPNSLSIAGLIDVPAPKGTVTAAIGAGHSMLWAYRGIKQLLGIDEGAMQEEQKKMNDLYTMDNLEGKMAKGGQIYGSLFEPAGMLVPVAKSKTLVRAAAKGFGVGAVYGASGYVDKEQAQTRMGNALMGGTLMGTFNGVFSGAAIRAGKKQVANANKELNNFELSYAETLLQGTEPRLAHIATMDKMPKGFSLPESSATAGRAINPPKTVEEAEQIIQFYRGTSKASDITMGADSVVGIVSTRVGNISQAIMGKLRKHDKAVLTNQHNYFKRVDGFLSSYNATFKAGSDIKRKMDKALLDGDFAVARRVMMSKGSASLVREFDSTLRVIDDIGNRAIELNVIKGKLSNYFPRYIKDHTGMLDKLGLQEKAAVTEALKRANLKATDAGRTMSAVDESDVINKVLRGYTPKERGGSTFTKQRGYKRIPSILQDFYSTPEESLHSYIRNMVGDIEKAQFFGKNIKRIKTGTAEIFNVDESVGAILREEMKINPMSNNELKELGGLLKTRFGIGETSPAPLIQNTKNLLYMALLANPMAAATQLGDIGVSVYLNGFGNTLTAVATKKKISVKDWGLADQLAEEFATTSSTAKWLRSTLKGSGFTFVDVMGKDILINSAYRKLTKQIRKPKGEAAFRKEYSKYLGDDLERAIEGFKKGDMNEEVQGVLFSKLADVQPISLSEVPELYLKMPNARVAYMLKTFMLKQVDIMRKDMYNEIKKGNIAKGLYKGARYALIMGAAGTASKQVKDAMLYGPTSEEVPVPDFDDLPEEFGMNLMKTFGWSEYVTNKLKDGKPVEAMLDAFAPPFEIVDKILSDPKESTTYMPIFGKLYNYWFQGGAEKAVARKDKREFDKQYKELLGGFDDS